MKYQVYNHTSLVPIAEFDTLTPCIKVILGILIASNKSWEEYFYHNPIHILDTQRVKTVWSTKCHE